MTKSVPQAALLAIPLLGILAAPAPSAAVNPAAAMQRAIAEAEASLQVDEVQIADSRYRDALLEGWLLMGALEVAQGDLPAARSAFERAAAAAVETRRAVTSLALVELHLGEAAAAASRLRELLARLPQSVDVRQLLAQALVAAGHPGEAIQELEEARLVAPEDPELAFTLATAYLREDKVEAAAALFAEVGVARPIPETWVLIGRTYRDFRHYEHARAALHGALEMNPQVLRAHYYLGSLELLAEGRAHLDEAIGHFDRELAVAPGDSLTHLYRGMALVEARRFDQAQPSLRRASAAEPPQADAFLYLGRSHLALGQTAAAVTALRRALELAAAAAKAHDRQLESIHYQLAVALRDSGARDDAAIHFAAAQSYSERLTRSDRDRLAQYLGDELEAPAAEVVLPPIDVSVLGGLAPPRLRELRQEVTTALARVYHNLGVVQVQARRFARAADFFAQTAEIAPGFPQVYYSLGVARFNAGQHAAAVEPLTQALAGTPGDADLRRMLALAHLNAESYAEAAELLADDPERAANPSLQYAYGMALVRSGRAAAAQPIFDELVARHGQWPELHVLLGQAHAQQGDYPAAISALEQALRLAPGVAEASSTLGGIYMRQGKLAQAEEALRAEIASHPDDLRARYHLATVLDLNRQPKEATDLLRGVLEARPEHADARYLLGKILLAGGFPEEAAEQLEAAAQMAPEDPNIHYQLGQAYQRLGRAELAQRQFETFRELKDKARGSGP
jgi:tetratricopeptide (TPR) repeat protein